MRGSDELFKLIKSLDKNEKRYFKLLTGKYETAKESNYVTLFDAIDAMDEYDEEKLKKKFRDKKLLKNLASEKNHLQRLILRSLRNYSPEPTIDNKIKDMIREAEFLHKKALHEQSVKTLAKAREMAIAYERHLLLLEIHQAEGMLILNTEDTEQLKDHLGKKNEEVREQFVNAMNLFEFRSNHLRSFLFNKAHGYDGRNKELVNAFKKMLSHELYTADTKAISFEAKQYFYFMKMVYHRTIRDYDNTLLYSRKNMELFQSNPMMASEMQHQHVAAVINYCLSELEMGDYDGCLDTLEKLRALPYTAQSIRLKIDSTYYPGILSLLIERGDFQRISEYMPEIKSFLTKNKGRFNPSKEMLFLWNICICYFGAAQYREALRWLNKLMNDQEFAETRIDLHAYARIVNLMIHYELNNFDLIENLLRSTGRYLNKKNFMYHLEEALIRFFGKVISTSSDKERKKELSDLKDSLRKVLVEFPEEKGFDAIDLLAWIDSKLLDKTIGEVVKMHLSQPGKKLPDRS